MKLTAEAKKWLKGISEEYQIGDKPGILILQTACEAFVRMREAQGILKKEGLYITDRYGQVKEHPACRVETNARSQMLLALKMLNLDIEPLRDGPGRPPGK